MNRDRLTQRLMLDEALRLKPYRCSEGKLTIGVGRNLDDKGLTRQEALYLLGHDIDDATTDARSLVPGFDQLDDVRQEVLVNMALNLGRDRLAGFRLFLAAVTRHDWTEAASQMRDSRWYRQVKGRAERLAEAMETGVAP